MVKRFLKPPRRQFPGHTPVFHGRHDWRCKCGLPLKSWKVTTNGNGDYIRTPDDGQAGAREAMALHRARLWIAWNDGTG